MATSYGKYGNRGTASSDGLTFGSNLLEYSVASLSQAIRSLLEGEFASVRVRGELSSVKIASSGHAYMTIKDSEAVLDAVCWKTSMGRLALQPSDGLEVIATGRITSYGERSKYQLIIESLERTGQGALLQLLEERKKKLAAEGLFDHARKKPLPYLPSRIGVITSPTGAVIRDILHRLRDRFPRQVIVWPVPVQGEGAANRIAKAIQGFAKLSAELRPELIIVARGGGSLEDLMAFQDEDVVRAAALCPIPLISAVGHETDWTLIDWASDWRAPTPTAAAERAVPVRRELAATLQSFGQRLESAMRRHWRHSHTLLEGWERALPRPHAIWERAMQKLDGLAERHSDAIVSKLIRHTSLFQQLDQRLLPPKAKWQRGHNQVKDWQERLKRVIDLRYAKLVEAHKQASWRLEANSHHAVLQRGYVIIKASESSSSPDHSKNGIVRLIADSAQLAEGQTICAQFRDGEIALLVDKAAKGNPHGPASSPSPSSSPKSKKPIPPNPHQTGFL